MLFSIALAEEDAPCSLLFQLVGWVELRETHRARNKQKETKLSLDESVVTVIKYLLDKKILYRR